MTTDTQTQAELQPEVNIPAAVGLGFLHLLALLAIPYIVFYGVTWVEFSMHAVFYFLGGFGITALYHRSWAHNAVRFSRPIEYFLAAFATLVIQMPARQWIVDHIDHHKHTDKDDDPYNIQRGFWWAHFEWIIYMRDRSEQLPARLADNPVVMWQDKYYWYICFGLNVAIPVGVGMLVGAPWWGSILLSSLRLVLMMNVIFSVNSVCHVWGSQPFTKDVSAKDVWWFPLALGEQYHNYHHAFPRDFRHGVRAWDFDPTKWLILGLSRLGVADGLVSMPSERIKASKVAVQAGVHGPE